MAHLFWLGVGIPEPVSSPARCIVMAQNREQSERGDRLAEL